jgi:hypothetical protein
MYRQGLISISSNQRISDQILSEVTKNGKIISDITSTQVLIFLINRPIGFLYLKIDNRTALRLASREMVMERINQLTGEVEYILEVENAYRFGRPPVYFITEELPLTAAKYSEYLSLAPYDKFQRREIVFIDNSTQKRYRLLYTQEGNTISVEMQTPTLEEEYFLPQWLHDLCYQNDGELLKNYEALQNRRRQKQIEEQERIRAEQKARKDAEAAERKRKAAEKKAAAKKAKALPKAAKKITKNATKPKPSKPVTEKKREENISDMWSNWAKGK